MIYQNLSGTTKNIFSIGTGSKRVDLRANSGVLEARHFGGIWFPVGQDFAEETLEPNGFTADISNITISYNQSTNSFEIDGDRSFYSNGVKYNRTGIESVGPLDQDVYLFIYYDADGVLTVTDVFVMEIIRQYAMVAVIYINSLTNEAEYLGWELHGCTMDGATHAYLHQAVGMRYVSGLALQDFTADGLGDSDTHAQFSVEAGTVFDEDIAINIVSTATPTDKFEQALSFPADIPVYSRSGTNGDWRRTAPSGFAVITGGSGRLAYNSLTTAWGQTEATDGYFIVSLIFATNDINYPIIAVQGQAEYATLNDVMVGCYTEMDNISYNQLDISDMHPLGAVAYQTQDTYTNSVKARIVTMYNQNYLDFRFVPAKQIYGNSPVSPGSYTSSDMTIAPDGRVLSISNGISEIYRECSDETTPLTVGKLKTFRLYYSFTLTEIRMNLSYAPLGSKLVVNIEKNGTTIFNTSLSIDPGEKTSLSAAVPYDLATTNFNDNDEIVVYITQVGSSFAGAGLKLVMLGTRS